MRSAEEDDELGITDMDAPEPSSDEEDGCSDYDGEGHATAPTVPTADEDAEARGAVGSVNAAAARAATMGRA